ncbi:MAG: hypothetical protein ABIE23_01500 [archaeon]
MEQFLFLTSKGQTSFEMLLVVALIISIAILILGNYFELDDSTIALAVLKTRTVEKLAEEDSLYVIKKIDYVEQASNKIDLNISTFPPDLDSYPDAEEIASEIASKTSYDKDKITITINITPVWP